MGPVSLPFHSVAVPRQREHSAYICAVTGQLIFETLYVFTNSFELSITMSINPFS